MFLTSRRDILKSLVGSLVPLSMYSLDRGYFTDQIDKPKLDGLIIKADLEVPLVKVMGDWEELGPVSWKRVNPGMVVVFANEYDEDNLIGVRYKVLTLPYLHRNITGEETLAIQVEEITSTFINTEV